MADYGHDLQFGVFITPSAADSARVVDLARTADDAGLDLATFQDHPYQPAHLDNWTLLSVIAAQTERIKVAPNVANLPMRHPVMIARAAATLDILSGGRVELGLGSGAFWDAIWANGFPKRTPGEAIGALEEAIAIIRALWTPDRTPRLEGKHYRLRGAKPGPFPPHDIGIWIGAYRPRMLRLVGRAADGWLPSAGYLPPEDLPAANAAIDEAATAAGRSPKEIRRLYNINGTLAEPERIAELALTEGVSGFVLATDEKAAIERFGREVAPAARELVAEERR